MVTKEEFNEIGKKYGLTICESLGGGFLIYVKDGITVSAYDKENKIVKICIGIPYKTTIVINNTKELENELQTTIKQLKEYRIKEKMEKIEEDFE